MYKYGYRYNDIILKYVYQNLLFENKNWQNVKSLLNIQINIIKWFIIGINYVMMRMNASLIINYYSVR